MISRSLVDNPHIYIVKDVHINETNVMTTNLIKLSTIFNDNRRGIGIAQKHTLPIGNNVVYKNSERGNCKSFFKKNNLMIIKQI